MTVRPSFDLPGVVQDLLAASSHGDLLARARRVASEAMGQPAYAAHVLPGTAWAQAIVLDAGAEPAAVSMAVRSATFAIHRRLSLTQQTLHLAREPDTQAIFAALLPTGPDELVAVPLRTRSGRLLGALITGKEAHDDVVQRLRDLETIAALAGPALESAWHHTQARRDQERMQLFSETTEESLWDWDVVLDQVWWGGNLEQLFGGRARVSKRPDWRRTRVHADDAERVIASFQQALTSATSSWNAEYRLRGVGDETIHVREHVYFLREVDGRAYRAIGTVRDISALQLLLEREMQARASAERASAVKDEFLAMLGHEMRNPLAPIVAVLSLLEQRSSGTDRHLDILRRQTQHLVRLVDDLLDVSRISTGKIELARQRTPLEPLIQRAMEMVQPLLEQRQHRVEIDIAQALEVDVDTARMTQVLSNLLANAAKYTEPAGHIRVSAQAELGKVVIRICDDGIGIAPDFLPTIFDMFTQGRQALDRAHGGLGLGLSIVKNIVKLHGGTVEAHSAGLGLGTEVTIRLDETRKAVVHSKELIAVEARASHATDVLIVDDNEDAAEVLAELLSATGHSVRIAFHPTAALQQFGERPPEVALLDIGLPSMDGYELVGRLRAVPGGADVKYIAVTGYGLRSDKANASAAGFDAHLVKPVLPDQLERLIAKLVAK